MFVLVCIVLWALIPVVAKLGQARLDNHQFLFWSSLVSLFVITFSVIVSGNISAYLQYSMRDWIYLLGLGLLGTYIYYLFLYLGYAQAKGMEVLVVQYTWPILIVVLSVFILKERITLRKILSVALGFLGVIVVLTKGQVQTMHIDNASLIALVAAGAACFALFSVLSKNVQQEPLGVVAVYFLAATIASGISMLFFSEFALPSSREIVPVLCNGILVNGFSYVFWLLALKSTEASYIAPYTFITPVLSALYLILFFDEPFVLAYGFGLVLVVAGGLINSMPERGVRS